MQQTQKFLLTESCLLPSEGIQENFKKFPVKDERCVN